MFDLKNHIYTYIDSSDTFAIDKIIYITVCNNLFTEKLFESYI